MMYCSISDVQIRLNSSLSDRDLTGIIESVSSAIDDYTHRTFTAPVVEERPFWSEGDYLVIDDALEITTIKSDGRNYKFSVYPAKAPYYAVKGKWGQDTLLTITARWGYAETVPSPIWDVAVIWTVAQIKAADAAYADATASPELQQLVYRKALPPDVRLLLQPYRRLT